MYATVTNYAYFHTLVFSSSKKFTVWRSRTPILEFWIESLFSSFELYLHFFNIFLVYFWTRFSWKLSRAVNRLTSIMLQVHFIVWSCYTIFSSFLVYIYCITHKIMKIYLNSMKAVFHWHCFIYDICWWEKNPTNYKYLKSSKGFTILFDGFCITWMEFEWVWVIILLLLLPRYCFIFM